MNIWGKFWNGLNGFKAGWGFSPDSPVSDPRIKFFIENGQIVWRNTDGGSGTLKELYEQCSPLASVIQSMANAYVNGKIEVLNPNNDKFVRGQYKDWQKLLDKPNWLQTGIEFRKQLYTYKKLNGFCFVLKIYPSGFRDRPAQLWVLPPWFVEIEPLQGKPLYSISREELLQKVYICYGGIRQQLDPRDLILFTDSSEALNVNTLLPTSRLCTLEYPITKLLSAEESNVGLIQQRGAMGIFSNEGKDAVGQSTPIDQKEREDIQRDFANYGSFRGQFKFIITDAALKYQSVTYPIKDMLLNESKLDAYKDICDRFGYPFPLTAHSDQSTYNNVRTASYLLYQDTIIPESLIEEQQWTYGLNPDEIKIAINYKNVAALQLTAKEKYEAQSVQLDAAQKAYNLGLVTRNDILVGMERDTIDLPEFNQYSFQQETNETQSGQETAGN